MNYFRSPYKVSKYYNKITLCGRGKKHRSKTEALRCDELWLLAANGDITGLVAHPQPRYPLMVGGVLITVYVADFAYQERGVDVVEDVKGMKTADYKIKAKLFEVIYGFAIRETAGGRK